MSGSNARLASFSGFLTAAYAKLFAVTWHAGDQRSFSVNARDLFIPRTLSAVLRVELAPPETTDNCVSLMLLLLPPLCSCGDVTAINKRLMICLLNGSTLLSYDYASVCTDTSTTGLPRLGFQWPAPIVSFSSPIRTSSVTTWVASTIGRIIAKRQRTIPTDTDTATAVNRK